MAETKKTVLVVEDDVFLAQLFTNRLQKLDINVVRAADGEEGLTAMKNSRPDLVLLDLILPKKSGFEVLEDVRADPLLQKIPIIIVSNLGQESDISRGKQLGAVEYYVKAKTSIDGLIERVRALLNQAGAGAVSGSKAAESAPPPPSPPAQHPASPKS